ncbi:hypothetical protein HPB48_026952 [Haemaphysalis longicornis]|uniref:Ssl1-like domain-containing protein n=1 Tax=Haemaphysalis longicornis TaxID=44386 RepID=A0A9J6HCS1_HAELO|nr:hypothetical protein HPB48_026952 [Haemaphysalis longicornis]
MWLERAQCGYKVAISEKGVPNKSMCKGNIRCSVVGLAAEVHVCCKLTKSTGGTYSVIMDENHFRDVLFQHAIPPPVTGNAESSLIRMGFPFHRTESEGKPSLCFCHLDSPTPSDGLSQGGYFCPQCNGKYCNLPVECKGCGEFTGPPTRVGHSCDHARHVSLGLRNYAGEPKDAAPMPAMVVVVLMKAKKKTLMC